MILHCNWHLLLLSARKKEKNDKRIVNEESSAFQKEEIPGWAKLVLLVLNSRAESVVQKSSFWKHRSLIKSWIVFHRIKNSLYQKNELAKQLTSKIKHTQLRRWRAETGWPRSIVSVIHRHLKFHDLKYTGRRKNYRYLDRYISVVCWTIFFECP